MSFFERCSRIASFAVIGLLAGFLHAQITYQPYIQPGDSGPFGPSDQMVVAWQTNESTPHVSAYSVWYSSDSDFDSGHATQALVTGRVVDNYLSADPVLAAVVIPTAYGPHVDYYAVLAGLKYDKQYSYRVTGPGLPAGGFVSSFHTRTQQNRFSFQVQGDEGYYPNIPSTLLTADYEARIIHTMYNVDKLFFSGQPQLTRPDFALNTGDNVYIAGGDSNYRDVWFPTWNSNVDSNEMGAPFIRSIPLYIVPGNHDVGSTGATANLLADNPPTTPGVAGPGPFGGGLSGGDALAYFNNYYFPLNGPTSVDIQYQFNGGNPTPSNFFFQYNGFNSNNPYNSAASVEALRGSTSVDSGKGPKRQIDHMSNYSFDYGNAHFVFLDANPHLFDNLLPGAATYQAPPDFLFPPYPSVLRDWLINDLDSSDQTWKIVVYHQPAFSSGNATLRNDQMRAIAQFLEDHGVNMVFNGHEHNYQRTLPIRAQAGVTQSPSASGPAAVAVDTSFDGAKDTVPDGVLYFVEGAGGNRDFDDAFGNPRGSSAQTIDQDDSATGMSVPVGGNSYPNGPNSWLDTHLTNTGMSNLAGFSSAGSGQKITARFKAKVFSFADIIVDDNRLTLYQISEPLKSTSSATAANPLPFGTDINGNRLNDPIDDTVFDPVTLSVTSAPEVGTPALLDKVTVEKPDLHNRLDADISAPHTVSAGDQFAYTFAISNGSNVALNGTQAILSLPDGVQYVSASSGSVTLNGADVIVTLGRLAPGDSRNLQIVVSAPSSTPKQAHLVAKGKVRSSTAMPTDAGSADTKVNN